MAEEKAKKVNNASKYISKDVIVIAVVLIAIAAYIIAECYSATHVDIQTVTAVKSTVYQTLDKKALVIRDEHTVEGNSSGVTVACVNDGEKVKVGGNIAMVFSNSDNAKSYSSALDLQSRLDYYINLESKSAGTATDVEQIDSDVINDVNDYIRSSSSNNFSAVQSAALDLNDKLTRRQMIIGEDIDFSTVKQGLEQKLNAINLESCKPTGYVSTKESGIFSSYSDGCETAFDYKNIDKLDVNTLDKYIAQAKKAKKTDSLGKLITDYEWYFACKVSADEVKGIENGDILNVALKDSDKVIECEVVSGATLDLGVKEAVLILRSSEMDSELASMRLEKFIPDEARIQSVQDNYKKVLSDVKETAIKAGRNPDDVRLMAVTKTVESFYINKVLDLGADLIGENRVQEFLGKKDELHLNGVEKHLIGHLQTNKVKQIVGEVDMIESVDSVHLAKEISKISSKKEITTNILLEVNVGKEESKSGIFLEGLNDLIAEVSEMENIKIKGLMTIPPICDSEAEVSKYFESMYQTFIDIKNKKIDNVDMDILSMGMSHDYEAAVKNGSNIVRVGSAIFGARKYF